MEGRGGELIQDYAALAAVWPSVAGDNDFHKLQNLNATAVGETLWPQANGWQGPLNQNDLVPAGIYTDAQRKEFEDTYLGMTL